MGQLGFTVLGGALVGLGVGYGLDALGGGRAGRVAGIVLGLAGGVWSAGQQLKRMIKERQGDKDP